MKQQKSSLKIWLSLLILALILVAVSYFFFFKKTNKNSTNNAVTAEITLGDLENLVTATGKLEPRDHVDVGAQVSGQLKELLVEVGDQVKEGQLLAEIDPTVFASKVSASRAQLRYQQAQLIDRLAQLELAQINYDRENRLYKKQATTEETLLNSQASLRSAKAQVEMIQAQINQTESTLIADEANLEYAKIYAPMDGTVVSISAKRGQTLNANQQAPVILQIADLSTMRVETEVSEADISRLRLNMSVYFTTLGSGTKSWNGKLQKIEPTPKIENNVVLYNALFDVPNKDQKLMSKMTAQVFFVISSAKDVMVAPISAINYTGRGGKDGRPGEVILVMPDGSTKTQEITVGITNRVQAEIKSGLKVGDKVLLQNPANANKKRPTTPRMMGPRLG